MNKNNKSPNVAQANYASPLEELWTGRTTKPALGTQYWHQQIKLVDWMAGASDSMNARRPDVALLGYACDEGVRRNLGRTGAKEGPRALRQQLAKLAYHTTSTTVVDVGNVVCDDGNLEACQEALGIAVRQLITSSTFPIVLGGGHDVAFGHFQGIYKAVNNTAKPRIGIVNFDAHFDLRPLEGSANSGTPFYQILTKHGDVASYFVVGIQKQSNTTELFDNARKFGVEYVLSDACELFNFERIKKQLATFVTKNDWIYITIDMDGFSSAYSPGVSAPSPIGFAPNFVFRILEYLMSTQKVISCDVAELNPGFDRDSASAKLGARLVDFLVSLH